MDPRPPIVIAPASATWAAEFADARRRLADGFGDLAVRIDHIGSTSVEGLNAKDVIDVQVTVASLDDPRIESCIEASGFAFRPDITSDNAPGWDTAPASDWRKRYAREKDGRRVHVHIREAGKPNQRFALLFRDYLRADPAASKAYEVAKVVLAELSPDRKTYVEAKDRFLFDLVFLGAERWATATGWSPGD